MHGVQKFEEEQNLPPGTVAQDKELMDLLFTSMEEIGNRLSAQPADKQQEWLGAVANVISKMAEGYSASIQTNQDTPGKWESMGSQGWQQFTPGKQYPSGIHTTQGLLTGLASVGPEIENVSDQRRKDDASRRKDALALGVMAKVYTGLKTVGTAAQVADRALKTGTTEEARKKEKHTQAISKGKLTIEKIGLEIAALKKGKLTIKSEYAMELGYDTSTPEGKKGLLGWEKDLAKAKNPTAFLNNHLKMVESIQETVTDQVLGRVGAFTDQMPPTKEQKRLINKQVADIVEKHQGGLELARAIEIVRNEHEDNEAHKQMVTAKAQAIAKLKEYKSSISGVLFGLDAKNQTIEVIQEMDSLGMSHDEIKAELIKAGYEDVVDAWMGDAGLVKTRAPEVTEIQIPGKKIVRQQKYDDGRTVNIFDDGSMEFATD